MSQKCKACGGKAKIVDSRAVDKNATRRRYFCPKKSCGERWSTIELIVQDGVQYKIMNQQLQASANTVSTLLKIRHLINKTVGGTQQ